mgnify:CR=1 FL=1
MQPGCAVSQPSCVVKAYYNYGTTARYMEL